MVNQVGYILLREERLDDAIRAFEMNADLYPSSANVFDSLGDAYEAACRWEEARESFATAYRMGSEGSNPNAETYKANLDRLTAKIESGQKCVVGGSLLGTD
jgi:tetratricopeptide (TPR) repeat protein